MLRGDFQAGASGQASLNRMVNSSDTDHADTIASLSGYSQDMELGFPWISGSAPGVAQLDEAFNSEEASRVLALLPLRTLLKPGEIAWLNWIRHFWPP